MEDVFEAERWFACLGPLVSLLREEGGHQLCILAPFPPGPLATWLTLRRAAWEEKLLRPGRAWGLRGLQDIDVAVLSMGSFRFRAQLVRKAGLFTSMEGGRGFSQTSFTASAEQGWKQE